MIVEDPDEVEEIWKNHLNNQEELQKYAQAMAHLAEKHWKEKAYGETRIQWCYQTIKEYFAPSTATFINGLQRKLQRDAKKGESSFICCSCQERIASVDEIFLQIRSDLLFDFLLYL